jgi:adenine-specific DNA-methyltransferase
VNDSKNIFIEGENLEVLKILQKSYAGKIKMIYIDPPYNTGNDFVYDDDFTEPLQEYLRRTGQVDEEGKPLTTNKRSDGRFHSKWLSMMYPRLRLARNLLRDDGVIFISIDDNEVHNLRSLMDELFGEENFNGTLVVKSTPNARNYGQIGKMHEYCLMYCKNLEDVATYELEEEEKEFKYEDSKGGFNIHPLYNSDESFHKGNRPNLFYPFYFDPKSKDKDGFYSISVDKTEKHSEEVFPPLSSKNKVQFVWRWSKEKASENLNLEIIGYGDEGEYRVVRKMRHTSKIIRSMLLEKEYSGRRGTAEVEKLFGKKVFSFPKPLALIKTILSMATEDSDLVLDFFGGSGTFGHAVYENNIDRKESINYICVQIPDELDATTEAFKAGYRSIAEITKDRLIKSSNSLLSRRSESNLDLGFRVLKLNKSNYKKWSNFVGTNTEGLELTLELFNSKPLRDDWKLISLISEIKLLEGFTLSSIDLRIEKYKQNDIHKISDEYCEHNLIVCLDGEIKSETIEKLELLGNDIFICLDSAISNVDKLRLSDKGLIKTI